MYFDGPLHRYFYGYAEGRQLSSTEVQAAAVVAVAFGEVASQLREGVGFLLGPRS